MTIDVLRNGKAYSISAVPRSKTTNHQGALGVELAQGGVPRETFFVALWDGLRFAAALFVGIVIVFKDLILKIFTNGSLLEGVVGPVGIFSVAKQGGEIGLAFLLQLLGIISINLTVVNLIPFPALDGGRLLLLFVEKLKGSPIPRKLENYANAVGFVLLLVFMVLLTVRDITNL